MYENIEHTRKQTLLLYALPKLTQRLGVVVVASRIVADRAKWELHKPSGRNGSVTDLC